MRVLVTGTEGYLGALLAPLLMADGHDVVGLDTGYYLNGWLYNDNQPRPRTIVKDIRDVTEEDLEGMDAVVTMAELSNDPIGDLIGEVTFDVNHKGSSHIAELAKRMGIERFIYMSSCSVYGVADGTVDETSPVNPQTSYAKCKKLVEDDLQQLADDNFSPTFLRNATAFGASPRQRFDIVLPNLCGLAWTQKRIAMTSDGTPHRPLVHGLDIAQAIRMILTAPRESVHNQILNVGSNENNYTVKEIAQTVAAAFPGCELSFGDPSSDNRSYQVNFDKIESVLPGYRAQWSAADGAKQMYDVFASIDMDPETFTGRGHTRLKQIQHLMKTGQVDDQLFWVKR